MDYIQLEKLYNLGRVPGLRTFHKVGGEGRSWWAGSLPWQEPRWEQLGPACCPSKSKGQCVLHLNGD